MLHHVFKAEANKLLTELFDSVDTLDKYLSKLRELGPSTAVGPHTFVAHGFGAFVEAYVGDKGLIRRYKGLPSADDDMLVQGIGINAKDKPCSLGSVYVREEDESVPLTSNRNQISGFIANSMAHHAISAKDERTMFLASNADKIHEKTYEQFIKGLNLQDALVLLMKHELAAGVDGDESFWESFRGMFSLANPVFVEKSLREHQYEAVEACEAIAKGTIILPTGTGKTIIASSLIDRSNKRMLSVKRSPVSLVASPRIVLTTQIIQEIVAYNATKGIDAKYVSLNSSSFDEDELKEALSMFGLEPRNILSTTSSSELETAYYESYQNRIPLIIGSTYHSAPRMSGVSFAIDLLLADEAHNLVQSIGRFSEEFKREFHNLKSKRRYFFTATPAYSASENGTGMGNDDLFGAVLYKRSPKEMIEKGEIIPPYIHRVVIDEYMIRRHRNAELTAVNLQEDNVSQNVEMAASVVVEAFNEHRSKVKQYSSDPDAIGSKMLVVCRGEQSFSGLFERSEVMSEFVQARKEVSIYGISSASGSWLNGEKVSPSGNGYKEKFMRSLKEASPERRRYHFPHRYGWGRHRHPWHHRSHGVQRLGLHQDEPDARPRDEALRTRPRPSVRRKDSAARMVQDGQALCVDYCPCLRLGPS